MTRRGATSLVGILPIDKPAGMTSHDVVAALRRATGEGRIGHAGTLDPMATGLLVVVVGAYARLAPYLTSAHKSYDATISFGTETDTDDAEGETLRTAPVPAPVLDPEYARGVLDGFLGGSSQTPPAFSAIKVAGQTAHRAARAGNPLELEPREVDVIAARLVRIDPDTASWEVSFTVSKGTYIRALARDIGRACGSAAHLSALRRSASGTLTLTNACSLDEAVSAAAEGRIESLFADPVSALGLPTLEGSGAALASGSSMKAPEGLAADEGALYSITRDGRLAAVYRVEGDLLKAVVVFPGVDAA